jgi:GNAT superfamily N-acetyltransferase
MTVLEKILLSSGLTAMARIARVGLDDFSSVRYVHANAIRALAGALLSEQQIDMLLDHVRAPAYTDGLLRETLYGAWIGDKLVATASWCANDDTGSLARIGSVFVDPLFTRVGLGRRMVAEVEARALRSGFDRFAARATANAVPFFEQQGYNIASHGILLVCPGCAVPVAFMRKTVPSIATGTPPGMKLH